MFSIPSKIYAINYIKRKLYRTFIRYKKHSYDRAVWQSIMFAQQCNNYYEISVTIIVL